MISRFFVTHYSSSIALFMMLMLIIKTDTSQGCYSTQLTHVKMRIVELHTVKNVGRHVLHSVHISPLCEYAALRARGCFC